ncbi:MAG: Holliday junction branch migration protein RuvA [Candidatus Vogelbacteria bacterium]|nr:Holliday junction branch migration protein RuvA [Candidatus Vogelbacteria bacterium]
MIGQLTGLTSHRTDRVIILDVGGVGYKLNILPSLKTELKMLTFWTYLAVRENALDLYGFLEKRELDFFELLIGVSGIGPRSALAILSLAPPDVLEKAILGGDSGYLTKVSGIGKKSAEKIVLELKDKLGGLAGAGNNLQGEAEAVEALQSLGYSLREAREALKGVPAELETGAKIKVALKQLGGR